MSEPLIPLVSLADAETADMCGPDGCMIPANHPAITNSDATQSQPSEETKAESTAS